MSANLKVRNIEKRYPTRSGELIVLRDISLAVEQGDSVAIMGPSGSGKSTLLNILGTLEPPTTGTVSINDCDPFEFPDRELARFRNQQIGFVFQEHHLLPQCSVLENVLLPTLAIPGPSGSLERAHALIKKVGLADRSDHLPSELSGGEKLRVAIARALINEPALILADEPTGNLDRVTGDKITDLLFQLQYDQNVTLLIVTHSANLAKRAFRTYEMNDGFLSLQQGADS